MSPHTAGATTAVALAVVKTLVVIVGGTITFYAYKASRRTGHPSLRLLAIGFGLITLGFALAGVIYELLSVSLLAGVLIESLLMLAGFLVIAYSLYMT